MENNSRIRIWASQVLEKLNEQVWFQQLKSKWEELDHQSRRYLKYASLGGIGLVALFILFSSIWSVHKIKTELAEKSDLLTLLQSANDELRTLRDTNYGNKGMIQGGSWQSYLEAIAQTFGIEKTSLEISPEKPGGDTGMAKESLFDITLKHVNIKQIIRYAFSLENGQKPVKLRNLMIDTKSDPTGYMDATLAVSAFTLK